jgi:uncharacterized ferritin-like protein (DUF455 family)
MELRDWAERIVHGAELTDKLWFPPDGLSDEAPGRPAAVGAPARTPSLALSPGDDTPLPRPSALRDPAVRVRLLHAFANHELLALELMALVLLRFPEAPRAFRLGTARVMRDEQRHLAMYRGRIRALGGELGDHRLSGFFWRALAGVESPAAFVARMGLVLEQANLDWCTLWGARFAEAGDPATARIVHQVYEDEIGHVAHALRFHRAWKPDEDTDWQAFLDNTAPPMGPGRARGPVFDHEGRQRAGLDADFIGRVRHHGQSRGRPPVVWLFDPTTEESCADGRAHWTPGRAARALTADLAALPGVLGAAGDVVVVPGEPAADWLAHRAAAGLPSVEHRSLAALAQIPRIAALEPWGWSPRTQRLLADLAPQQAPPAPPALARKHLQVGLMAGILNGTADAPDPGWLLDPGDLPTVLTTPRALGPALDALWAAGDTAVLKAPLASAGRGLRRWRPDDDPAPLQAWAERVLSRQAALTVGPWLERVADLSWHGDRRPDGTVRVLGRARTLVDDRGTFRGVLLGRAAHHAPPALRRFFAGDGQAPRWLDAVAAQVLRSVAARLDGYHGPVGIDALVCRRGGRLRLWPLVEVNPRWTMGRVGLALERRLKPGCHGVFLLLRRRSLAPELAPPQTDRSGLLQAGTVWLADPRTAQAVQPVLLVGPTRSALQARLDTLDAGTLP